MADKEGLNINLGGIDNEPITDSTLAEKESASDRTNKFGNTLNPSQKIILARKEAKAFLDGLAENDGTFFHIYAGDKKIRDKNAQRIIFAFKNYGRKYMAETGEYRYHLDYALKKRALAKELAFFRPDNGDLYFANVLKKDPNTALEIMDKLCGTYDYLCTRETIAALSYDGMTYNRARRQAIMNGEKMPCLFEEDVVTDFFGNNNNILGSDFAERAEGLHTEERKKVLRAVVLSKVAKSLREELANHASHRRALETLSSMCYCYPDMLDAFCYDGDKKIEDLIFSLPPQELKIFLERTVKIKRTDHRYEAKISPYYTGYALSPEEMVFRAIKTGDKETIATIVRKTADVFTATNRKQELVDNMISISLTYPDFLETIMGTFANASDFDDKENIMTTLLAKAKEESPNIYSGAINVYLAQQDKIIRENILAVMKKQYLQPERRKDDFMQQVRQKVLTEQGRLK